MAKWRSAPIIGGAYSDDAKAWSSQDTVNYIPVMAERSGSRSPSMLRGVPGVTQFCDLGTNAPIRGMHNAEGLLLVVSSNKLFSVSAKGAPTLIGTIPGVERVSIAHNQIAGGNEVAIANGQSGYVYNTFTGALTQITDNGFAGAISFDFLDGYIMGIEPGRRFAFHSDLAAATSYNTLDRYEAEGSPDKLVGQIVTHREWWLFGERTIEPYVDTGAGTGTFQRSSGTVIEIGAASRYAICQMDNSVFWLGHDGAVYRANGYTPTRISTHAIEQEISRSNIAQAFAFTYEDRGHKVYYLTFPDGHTWGYDAASGEWHRRKSEGLDRWRVNDLTLWSGQWIAGDYSNGKLYRMDWAVQNEAGGVLERRRITGVLSDNQNPVNVNGVALVFDTGGLTGAAPYLGPITISGDLPDGAYGDSVRYQYVVSGGAAPVGPVTIASGTLPTGLSMSASGLITGTLTTGGTFSWSVSANDADGNPATLSDLSRVSIVAWWLTAAGTPVAPNTSNVWISADPRVWPSAPVLRSPFTIVPDFGAKWMGGNVAFIVGGGADIERTTNLNGAAGITTAKVTVAAGIEKLSANGSNYAVSAHNSPNWYTSTDAGLTWTTQYNGTLLVHSICAMAIGRWVAYREYGASYGFVYSDEIVPTAWVSATGGSNALTGFIIGTNGVVSVCAKPAGGVYRTTDGITWSSVTGPNILADSRSFASNGNTLIIAGQNAGGIYGGLYRSADAGLTWSSVSCPIETYTRIEYGRGYWVTRTGSGGVYVSIDDGLTWIASTTPVVAGANFIAAPVVYVP